jgi:hypothetical protein
VDPRKISSTICTGPISSTGCLPVSMRGECRLHGTIASRAPRFLRDGPLRCSTMVSTATRPTARSI